MSKPVASAHGTAKSTTTSTLPRSTWVSSAALPATSSPTASASPRPAYASPPTSPSLLAPCGAPPSCSRSTSRSSPRSSCSSSVVPPAARAPEEEADAVQPQRAHHRPGGDRDLLEHPQLPLQQEQFHQDLAELKGYWDQGVQAVLTFDEFSAQFNEFSARIREQGRPKPSKQ